LIKYALTQLSKGYGTSGQSELMLNDSTVIISDGVTPILATSRTFMEADVRLLVLFECQFSL